MAGSVLEELAASENRLHFRRLAGTGPDEGAACTKGVGNLKP